MTAPAPIPIGYVDAGAQILAEANCTIVGQTFTARTRDPFDRFASRRGSQMPTG